MPAIERRSVIPQNCMANDWPFIFIAFAAGLLFVWGYRAGQIAMKQKVRQQLNQCIEARNISVKFRDGSEISAEQTLDFMCYGKAPDPTDPTSGVSTYNPH